MSKQSLMLSAAMAALLAGPAYAACTESTATLHCVTTSTTTALTTGDPWTTSTVTTAVGTPNVGNIDIESGGAVTISTANIGAITVNSNHYVYSNGGITNEKQSNASAILIDVSNNPDLSGASFVNAAGTTITGAGIYLDAASTLNLTGTGTGKRAIFLDGSNVATDATGTYTGDIIFNTGSNTVIAGDSSVGVLIASNAILHGNLNLGGTFTVTQTTASSTTASGLYGLHMLGQVQGNILLPSGGSMTILGAGAQGMSILGSGVTGSITIGGTLATGAPAPTTSSYYTNTSKIVYPEAGAALTIGAGVGNGIAILGNTYAGQGLASGVVATQGVSPAVVIGPNTTLTSPMRIGVYTTDGTPAGGDAVDPGFSFVNRGSISATPANVANSASSASTSATGIAMGGSSVVYPVLVGGFFNSGTLSAGVQTTGTVAPAVSATALNIGGYTTFVDATYDTATNSWNNLGTLTGKKDYGDSLAAPALAAPALVNSSATGGGTISATVSGSRGGIATAISIASTANVPSIFNSGTISAAVSNSDPTLDGQANSHPVAAYAIVDQSGTLNSIYNEGTISAAVSALDNGSQIANAILLGNRATGTQVRIDNVSTQSRSATIAGNISFGSGGTQILNIEGTGTHLASVTGNVTFNGTGTGGDQLTIGSYGSLSGTIIAHNGVSVDIAQNGLLTLANTTAPLYATTFAVHGGTTPENGGALVIGVSNTLGSQGVISATGSVEIERNARLGLSFNSFVPQGSPDFVLITAPLGQLNVVDLASYSDAIGKSNQSCTNAPTSDCGGSRPFLFASAELKKVSDAASDRLVLQVVPKTATELNLTGYAKQLFPYANTALGVDTTLGAAMVNLIRNEAQAQAAYNSFAPNVTGGSRAIAISITDQATGAVGARLRMLNLYGKQEGGTTLWSQEFFQMIKDPGQGALQLDGTKEKSGFKDHGFGFALGIDGGTPKYGWYGAALTFYTGDVGEIVRNSHTNQQWYVLSGYSSWRGKGLFLNTKIDAGYGNFDSKRYITLQTDPNTIYSRRADSKHAGALISGGVTTGALFSYGATTLSPQLSVDGLLMREEGYTEKNPGSATVGDGFNLKVQPYYAKSLRLFLGGSVRYDIDLWDFYLQPEAHTGYRYDVFNDPAKLKAAFAHADLSGGSAVPGTQFTLTGPDPSQGNFVLGGSLATTTDTWTLGVNFDFVRGSNGALQQVGTINLLGRI